MYLQIDVLYITFFLLLFCKRKKQSYMIEDKD